MIYKNYKTIKENEILFDITSISEILNENFPVSTGKGERRLSINIYTIGTDKKFKHGPRVKLINGSQTLATYPFNRTTGIIMDDEDLINDERIYKKYKGIIQSMIHFSKKEIDAFLKGKDEEKLREKIKEFSKEVNKGKIKV